MLPILLEYSAFGASLLCSWVYGYRSIWGPIVGVITALLFIAFGLVTGLYAACVANLIFLAIHTRNGVKFMQKDPSVVDKKMAGNINQLRDKCHDASRNAGWWNDPISGEPVTGYFPTKLCLIHSEISEAMEGHRKGLMDDKLPHREMAEVELADAVIRIMDLAGREGYDIGGAIAEKMAFNAVRPDHKVENRRKAGGKNY